MKNPLLFLLVAGSIASFPACSRAQVGTMRWHFRSRSAVTAALQQTRGNLRKTYEVLVCAGRQGFCNTSIGYYEDVVTGHEFDATFQDSAAYAFAFDIGYVFRPWSWKIDPDKSMIKKSTRATAQLFRERALAMRPQSPEVLVMRCLDENMYFSRKEAYQHTLQAVKRAPNWADAHYWLAWSACSYALTFNRDVHPVVKKPASKVIQVRLGKLALKSYDRAQKLDLGLRPYLYIERVGAYELIADRNAARMIPICLNVHLQAFPWYAEWYRKTWGDDEQQLRVTYSRIAADIAKNATN